MIDDTQRQRLAGRYGPMLDDLQRTLESELGPVTWTPRADAVEVTRHDGSRALRVAAINAIGVPTPDLRPRELSTAVNDVLARWRFPVQPPMTGSASGELICEAVDAGGAEFTLLVKQAVDAWVDQPL